VLISIYGVYVINRLRVEAFDARQINQYRLGRKLGSGGMGEVYLAEHELLKRPCAVKLINLERMGDPRAIARFEREVRTTAGLSHPHTVDIYDYGRTDEGVFYYVMEYLRGMNLAQLVSKYGPLDPSRAVFLLRAACEALHEAHRAGLVHRDLKPANIFAATRGGRFDYVKLLDFGLVKTQQEDPDSPDMSEDGRVIGSPSFMSPEQALGEGEVDARSDVYSLGAVGYYLLTGEPPFIGRSVMRVMVAHARDPVRRPSELRPDLPSDLEAVVLRCLEKAPEDRYPDASSLAAALGSCEAGMGWSFERARLWWEANESPPPRAGLSDPIEATAF
jgi:serine/threonine-protein kinase